MHTIVDMINSIIFQQHQQSISAFICLNLYDEFIKEWIYELAFDSFLLKFKRDYISQHLYGSSEVIVNINNPSLEIEQVSCMICHRQISATKFAPHLSKCMGISGTRRQTTLQKDQSLSQYQRYQITELNEMNWDSDTIASESCSQSQQNSIYDTSKIISLFNSDCKSIDKESKKKSNRKKK